MEIVSLPNGTEAVVAEYKEQLIKDYEGNPFIECLPSIRSPKQVIEQLAYYPAFDPNERLLEPYMRVHLLQRLFQYFQPTHEHIRLEQAISTMLRSGYVDRNPFSPSYVRWRMGEGKVSQNASPLQNSSSKSLTLIGISGSGKTSSLSKILSLTPQVIVHSKYRGMDFPRYQVSHLRIEAPYDGSLKALCLQFFMTIDALLGTNYMEKYGNGHKSTNIMIPIISKLLVNLGVGLLVIDEIQHLSLAKSGGSAAVLNFFTTLINTANIPIVLVGTPKSLNVLQSEFRQARRNFSGHGNFFWDRLSKDESWDLFLSGLWKYQWVQKPVELTDELSSILFDETQGIPDVVVKLFMMLQVRAISTGNETIKGAMIRKVANEQLKLIRPMIEALRNGRTSQLLDYQDIVMPDVTEFMNKEQSQIQVQTFIKETQKRSESRQQQITHLREDAVIRLQLLGVKEKEADGLVQAVLAQRPTIADLNELVQVAYQCSTDKGKEKLEEKEIPKDVEGDLREIVKVGAKEGISAYEALKRAEMIRNDFGCTG
ncbi:MULTISPECIES: ATP-binding protein [Brevibacillus]|uniref:ATP-binding protein n=1 Tax=Brevibacillus TaxID=55080 RepID=UPI001561E237|nr:MULTISPECIES: ATP-binding protein [Brevibacillus]MBE5395165.1 ATP-binding protein [Brevibacillus borstelensis]MCC0567044.1 ATP-binding protein [Brevibacillus borstelensis]MCM3473393.1 ATP-binding protein [Brevibacillus borstelensis]MDN4095640.1 ATP-binding protein [Brevibacillus agri]MED1850093.1 ATP-binding protein [Brevibacillus borstelensis]